MLLVRILLAASAPDNTPGRSSPSRSQTSQEVTTCACTPADSISAIPIYLDAYGLQTPKLLRIPVILLELRTRLQVRGAMQFEQPSQFLISELAHNYWHEVILVPFVDAKYLSCT